jgi:hypothetical protein
MLYVTSFGAASAPGCGTRMKRASLAEYRPEHEPMDHVRQGPQPGYFQQAQHEEGWPLGAPSEPVRGAFLIGALMLCLDLWLLGVLAIRWLA